jgi:chromosome segregation ATPase
LSTETIHSIAAKLLELQRRIGELEAEQRQFEQKRAGAEGRTNKERQAYHDRLTAMSAEQLEAHVEECRLDREREQKISALITGLKLEQERLRARQYDLQAAEVEPQIVEARRVEMEAIEAYKEAENALRDAEQRRENLESQRRGYVIFQRRHEGLADELAVSYGLLLNSVGR